ncbi:MAG TPA: EAL domain-containing protein [Allosphingosinicella sp.]|jgi:diguanylate cyclase (GGDEF)-like protein|nr:EAL domain-containing protein [Allosphingosinicella sp.]
MGPLTDGEMPDEDAAIRTALLQEQFRTLRRQVPTMYLVMIVNAWFLGFATFGSVPARVSYVVPAALSAAGVFRAVRWLSRPESQPDVAAIGRLFRGVMISCVVFSIGFGGWGLLLFQHADLVQRICIALYIFISAVICAHSLQAMPTAGRVMLLCGAAPVTLRLLLTGNLFLIGLGLDLVFVSILMLRMLTTSHSGFVEMLSSRLAMLTEREKAREAERHAHQLAYHDPLTGLPNRRALADQVEAVVADPGGEGGLALLMVDLDHFKSVNDVHGHPSGDALLRQVAERLAELVGQHARAFRLGGDEFAILSRFGADHDAPRRMARRIVQGMSEPFEDAALVHHIGASVGISLFPIDAHDRETLMRRADIALYRAKEGGRGQYRSFEPVMDAEIKRRSALESELRAAIAADRLRPFYQPLVALETGRITAFELLARWPRDGEEIGPSQFISIAEEAGLVTELMLQLLRRGCAEALAWDDTLTLGLNVSPVQLKDAWLAEKILATLARTGFPPRRLAVEITENALIVDPDNAKRTIESLKNQGIGIVLDDFGTGYSSLQHLRMLPFDEIKIDRSFVRSIDTDPEALKMVRAIVGLASTLGMPVVAEGIETESAAKLCRELGCAYGQGFHFGHPMSGEQVAALARTQAHRRARA